MAAPSRRTLRLRRAAPPLARLLALLALAACTAPAATVGPTVSFTEAAPTPSAGTPPPSPAAFPLTLIDDEGTSVEIPALPQRIVSLTPATTEILYAIGAGPRVVGKVEDVASFPPEAANVPVLATFSGVDVERIVAAEADLVVAGGSGLSQGPAIEQLRRAGIPVLVVYPTSVDDALAGIRTVGRATGETDAAETLAASMETQIAAIEDVTAGIDRPRVYYEIDYGQSIFTPPAASIYGQMIRLAGGDPISGDPSYAIALEALVAADPQVILLGDAVYGVTSKAVTARPGWGAMSAVISGRIHPIDDILVTRPGPRLVQGLAALLAAIHPDLASDSPLPTLSP